LLGQKKSSKVARTLARKRKKKRREIQTKRQMTKYTLALILTTNPLTTFSVTR
jgi:hypothetical protein